MIKLAHTNKLNEGFYRLILNDKHLSNYSPKFENQNKCFPNSLHRYYE